MSAVASATVKRPFVLTDLVPGGLVKDGALVFGGAIVTGAFAQISIPVQGSPVPLTGQTFAVLVVGAALGWRRGLLSMAFYLLAGAVGVPWYAGYSHGVDLPTFGYIVGFIAAAAVVGALAGRGGDRTPIGVLATMLVGNLVIYIFGVSYLMVDLHISLSVAWDLGVKSYLLGDVLKMVVAAGVLPLCWRVLRQPVGRAGV